MSDTVNLRGRTPEQSGIKSGDIRMFVHTQGNGKRAKKWRVQFPSQYLNLSSYDQAMDRWNKYLEREDPK